MAYIVIENAPGYLPEDGDPLCTDDYAEAVAHANGLADQLEEDGYVCDRSWASQTNHYAIQCVRPDADTVAPDLGRSIEVIEMAHSVEELTQ